MARLATPPASKGAVASSGVGPFLTTSARAWSARRLAGLASPGAWLRKASAQPSAERLALVASALTRWRSTPQRCTHSCVRRSRSTDAPRLLAEATSRAVPCSEWVAALTALAKGPVADAERLAEVADRTLAAALAEGSIRGCTEAARARAKRLDDRGGARDALEAGERMLRARPSAGHPWATLAWAFARTLSDQAGAQRCLACGVERARLAKAPDALCAMADAMDGLGDNAGARKLVAEAEGLLGRGGRVAGQVASAWEEIGEPEAAARVLRRATADAADAPAALAVAEFRRRGGARDHVAPALQRARELAKTAYEWFEIAGASHRASEGAALVRSALERASGAADDDALRRQIALAFHVWLKDTEAADRVGPHGFRPETLRSPRRRLEGFRGSASGLFDWLRARVTPEMLAEIAQADYGQDAEEHRAALLDIQTTGLLPPELAWHPMEVVTLTRWARQEDLSGAWCCTLLWLCPRSRYDNQADTLPGLVASCLALGAEAAALAEQMLVWHAETDPRDLSGCPPPEGADDSPERDSDSEGVDPYAALGLLLLRTADDPADPRVDALVRLVREGHRGPGPLDWGISEEYWKAITSRILTPASLHDPPLAALLETLGLA